MNLMHETVDLSWIPDEYVNIAGQKQVHSCLWALYMCCGTHTPNTCTRSASTHAEQAHINICYQGRITMSLSKLNAQHASLKYPSMKTTLLKFGNVFTTGMTGNAVRTLNQGFRKAVHKARRTVMNR